MFYLQGVVAFSASMLPNYFIAQIDCQQINKYPKAIYKTLRTTGPLVFYNINELQKTD
jgi:hypothetical protein